jgi:imidazolonepropionase-like amidohydrolase
VLVVRSPAEARNAYNELEEQYHVDFISLRSGLSRDAYFALIERARMWGLPVAGDVPEGVTFDEAVGERQSSIEHLSGAAHALDGDSENAAALLDRMAKFGSYQVPALIKLRRMTYADADEVIRDPHLKEIPAAIRKSWTDPRLDEAKFSLEALDQLDLGYQRSAEIVARMQRCNVPIMAGTDTGDPYTFPGLDLHRELRLLVKAGLTPLQALRSATLTPAQFLELDDTLGTVATGKTADLVLLDADPLQDIGNTEKIAAVVIAGRYFTKAKLDAAVGQSR